MQRFSVATEWSWAGWRRTRSRRAAAWVGDGYCFLHRKYGAGGGDHGQGSRRWALLNTPNTCTLALQGDHLSIPIL